MAWAVGQGLQAGKYTIEAMLGEGGFGITYLARDPSWNPIVIKTLNDSVQHHPRFEQLEQDFVNEALWLAKCTHPHIVQVHRVFQEAGQWCLVMEYIAGQNLADRIKRQGVLSESEALWYVRQVGDALTLMHQNGLLHRDVKPDNIMIREEKPEAVLLDLGIAREFVPDLLQTHTAIISNGYAPIEQYEYQAKRGAYSDVYGLAATLYTLLTGKAPTDSTIRAFNLQRHGTDPVEPAQQLNPQISDQTNAAIIQGMAIEPEDRPQSLAAWLELLPFGVAPVPGSSQIKPVVLSTPPRAAMPQTAMQPQSAMVTLPIPHATPTSEPTPLSHPARPSWQPKHVMQWIGLGVGLAVVSGAIGIGVSRLVIAQRAEAAFTELKQLNTAKNYPACLTKAATMPILQDMADDVQLVVNECSAGLLDQAKQFASKSQYQEAIQNATQIPGDSRVSQESLQLINQWSDKLLEQAKQLYSEKGKLPEAIELLRSIPVSTPVGQKVEQTISQWQTEWKTNETAFKTAKQSSESGEWYKVVDQLNKLTTPYWQKQAADLQQEAESQIAAIEEQQRQQEVAAEQERQHQQEVAFNQAYERCRVSKGEDWRTACAEYEQLCQAQGGTFIADAGYVGCPAEDNTNLTTPQPAKPPKPDNKLPPEDNSVPVIPRLDR